MGLTTLLSIPFTAASMGSMLNTVWQKILWIGNFGPLGISVAPANAVVAFTRILIWILMFTMFFAIITTMGGSKKNTGALGFLNRNQAMVVAAVIATISAIFIPPQVLLATGAGWGTLIALILIGLPLAGIVYLFWLIPGKDDQGSPKPETRGTVFLKLLLCLLLFWILTAMKYYVSKLVGGTA